MEELQRLTLITQNQDQEKNINTVQLKLRRETNQTVSNKNETPTHHKTPIPNTGEIEIVEMDRMRKLISSHMTMSIHQHITSMVEVDMTNIVNWRNSIKKTLNLEKQTLPSLLSSLR